MPTLADRAPAASDFTFQLGQPEFQTDATTKLRKFSGIAYTGDPIFRHPYWGTVIFDLSLMKLPAKLAALRDHEGEEIVGYANESSVTSEGLQVGGILSSATEAGREVAALSDEGFPWQMSVRIDPERIEEVLAGSTTSVNGRSVTGPAYIFRESSIIEVSFTATGWDRGTAATALSRNNKEDEVSKELEDRIKQLEGDLKASRDNETALKAKLDGIEAGAAKQAADAKMSRVKEAYANAGQEITEDKLNEFANMPDLAVDALIDALKMSKPGEDRAHLFSHQTGDQAKENANGNPKVPSIVALCENKAKDFQAARR